MRKLVRRPSPAMVVAVAGVVVTLSGDAVADGVRAVASVVGKDQVTSRSVKDGSLLLRDIKRSERAKLKGRRGPRGAQGAPGTPALDKVFRKGQTFEVAVAPTTQCPGTPPNSACVVPNTQHATSSVYCDSGLTVIGGGVRPDDPQLVEMVATHPTADGRGWTATVANDDTRSAHRFDVWVLCAPVPTS